MPAVRNTRGEEVIPDPAGPTSVYFFKTGVEPHIGQVQYFKVMSGTIKEGDDLVNADRGSVEHISALYVCSGAQRDKVAELQAGDIGCCVKLKDVRTGNTLNAKELDHKFNFIKYPPAKFTRAIRAVNPADTEKMMQALTRMRLEDPTWVVEQSKELRQVLVHGQGEFTSALSSGVLRTSTSSTLSSLHSASLIARQSPRSLVPTIVTRSSRVVQVSSVRFTSSSSHIRMVWKTQPYITSQARNIA